MIQRAQNVRIVQILKFLFSGGTAAVVEYGLFLLLMSVASVHVLIANGFSFAVGLVISFLLNKHWVFGSRRGATRELAAYVTLAAVNLLLGSGLIGLLVSVMSVDPLVAKFLVMVMIAIWNYILFSKLIFRVTSRIG